jgi:DNA (cytosine-5)-methyltransferase 1
MRLLDLFCGAGGCSVGYHRAGFDVVGVDIAPQPNYPFEFHQADALTFPLDGFDAIHASPPCQHYSTVSGRSRKGQRAEYPDLVEPTRQRLEASGVPWVMENVIGAPLDQPLILCGSSFGLDVRRHRLFETGRWMVPLVPPCAHHWQKPRFRSLDSRQKTLASVIGVHGHSNYAGEFALRCKAMGIDWMTPHELTQAIPPAYTQFIGGVLWDVLTVRKATA